MLISSSQKAERSYSWTMGRNRWLLVPETVGRSSFSDYAHILFIHSDVHWASQLGWQLRLKNQWLLCATAKWATYILYRWGNMYPHHSGLFRDNFQYYCGRNLLPDYLWHSIIKMHLLIYGHHQRFITSLRRSFMSRRLTLIEWKYVLIWLASWFNFQLPVGIFILLCFECHLLMIVPEMALAMTI